jgi:hypothetical protein
MTIKLKTVAKATKIAISAKTLDAEYEFFSLGLFNFFPPPVLSGSGSTGRQQIAVLSAGSFSQLPKTLFMG